jgi:hypothetical protein
MFSSRNDRDDDRPAGLSADEVGLVLTLIEERLSYGPWPHEAYLSELQALESRLKGLKKDK